MNHWARLGAALAWGCLMAGSDVFAFTLWTEDAENGYGQVIDATAASYDLIQSSVVAQGDFAFHLANPGFADNSFVIDETISIQPDTKLFFQRRLRAATSSQFARVQISTDGGGTWPTTIYSQAGAGSPGESGFTLEEIDLDSYAGQNLRFRFFYEFTSGSAFTGTTSTVGWFVDDIQIGSEFEKTIWSIGEPTDLEQLNLEYINRARADALVEATRLRNETDPDILSAYSFHSIDGQDIEDQFEWYVNNGHIDQHAQPLSFQSQLLQAAQLHSQDMHDNQFQDHFSSDTPPDPFLPGDGPGDRFDAVGYDWDAYGENVYAHAESVAQGHAGFDVDWGGNSDPGAPAYNPGFVGQGMQNPAGHRMNIHDGIYKEAGIGIVDDTNGTVGPQIVTQDFGRSGDIRYITGVVYEDANGNEFYDLGEGVSDVRIDVDDSVYYALSSESGGYSVPVPADDTYEVTFSVGGFATFVTEAVVAGGLNVKIDYLVTDALLVGDYNSDGKVSAADFTVWRDNLGASTLVNRDPNNSGPVDVDDFNSWRDNYGDGDFGSGSGWSQAAAVPEPSAMAALIGLAACSIVVRRTPSVSYSRKLG